MTEKNFKNGSNSFSLHDSDFSVNDESNGPLFPNKKRTKKLQINRNSVVTLALSE